MDRDDPAYKGQAGYNPFVLAIYDPLASAYRQVEHLMTA
jgi:hypothetical protein